MSKDIETMINEAPVLTPPIQHNEASGGEQPGSACGDEGRELDRVHSRGRADTGGAKDDRQFRGEN